MVLIDDRLQRDLTARGGKTFILIDIKSIILIFNLNLTFFIYFFTRVPLATGSSILSPTPSRTQPVKSLSRILKQISSEKIKTPRRRRHRGNPRVKKQLSASKSGKALPKTKGNRAQKKKKTPKPMTPKAKRLAKEKDLKTTYNNWEQAVGSVQRRLLKSKTQDTGSRVHFWTRTLLSGLHLSQVSSQFTQSNTTQHNTLSESDYSYVLHKLMHSKKKTCAEYTGRNVNSKYRNQIIV